MTTTTRYIIPRVTNEGVDTSSAALDRFNAPIESIESALDDLSLRLDGIGGKSSVIYEHAPLTSGCFVGALVYYDANEQHFAPALAALLPEPGSQGESVEAPESRVVGIVVRVVVTGEAVHGAILCGGYWQDQNVVAGCVGGGALPGTYYLSPFDAGKAVTADRLNGRLQQGILTYMGDGRLFFNLHYLAHDNHWHSSRTVYGGWKPASLPPEGVTAPSGYQLWYNEESDSSADGAGYARLGELSGRTTAVFHEGLLEQLGGDFVVDGGYLWYADASAPVAGSVTVFNSFPFAYNSPVVRDVVSLNDALSVRRSNGMILLEQNAFADAGTTRSGRAVSYINGRSLGYTPVVSGITAGPGIVAQASADGNVTLAAADIVGGLHDAYVVDHNGTNQADDGVYPYIMFPAGRQSSLTMTMPLSGIPANTALVAKVWIMPLGAGAYNTVTRWLPQPAAGSPVELPSQTTSGQLSGGAAGYLSYSETSSSTSITGPGTLVTRISIASAPSADCKVFRMGYKFELAN